MKLRQSENTLRFTESYAKALPHAQLLSGAIGSGLGTLARYIANSNGQLLSCVAPESKTATSVPAISVEKVRNLYTDTKTKLNGPHFVIIDDADAMNHSAQNALLKLLEEPNSSIHFILTSHKPDLLLPTVRSRVNSFTVAPLNTIESRRHLKALGVTDALTEQRLLFVADGLPAELTRLAEGGSDFKLLAERVQRARELVQGTMYQRLAIVQSMKDDRQSTLKLLDMTISLLRRSLHTSADKHTVQMIDSLLVAHAQIKANGNAKLHLSNAML